VAGKLETAFEKLLFSSRWILAPIFLGLSLALIALGFKQNEAHESARAAQAVLGIQVNVEDLVRACLKKGA